GKELADGFITANALVLAKEAMAGMVWVKMVVMTSVVIGLALGGVGWAEYAASEAQTDQQPKARVIQPKTPAPEARAAASDSKPRVDLHGDPLPEGAVSRLGTIRFNH